MRRLLPLLALLAACEPSAPPLPPLGGPLPDASTDAQVADVAAPDPDVGLAVDGTRAPGTATLKAKVRMAKDFPNQIDSSYRNYAASGGKLQKGDLWLQLCADPLCHEVVHSVKVLKGQALTSTAKDIEVGALPAGSFHVRFGLDSQYSQDYAGAVAASGTFGPFDVLQAAGVDPKPQPGYNPPPGAKPVALAADATLDVGEAVLARLVVSDPSLPLPTEPGHVAAAVNGTGGFRNAVKLIDLAGFQVQPMAVPKVNGLDFAGDLCGFVRGSGSALYVLGSTAKGAYVFTYDLAKKGFVIAQPVPLPHPDCLDGKCPSVPDPGSLPWLCKGVRVPVGDKDRLYLIDGKGAGGQTQTTSYPMVSLEMIPAGGGKFLKLHLLNESPFLTGKRLFRGIEVFENALYLLEPSWSKQLEDDAKKAGVPAQAAIHKVPLHPVSGLPEWDKRTAFSAGQGKEKCEGSTPLVPAFAKVSIGGAERLVVGNDAALGVYDFEGQALGEVDLLPYGRLAVAAAVSPDGQSLFVLPGCKSAKLKAKVKLGIGTKTLALDRHAVMVLDLAGALPTVRDAERDFDEDGVADGGVDLDFLHLKRDLLRWCEPCSGVVPPTVYTGPALVATAKALILRGTGASVTSSGLGQVGDLGVFDLQTGKGLVFRKHSLWLDGPSARWGFDIQPEVAAKTPQFDQSVSALLYVAP